MPIMTDWLDLPEAPSSGEALFGASQPQPSVFAYPEQDRRNQIRGSIFTPKNQKKLDALTRFQAYQSVMRKEQEKLQAQNKHKKCTLLLEKRLDILTEVMWQKTFLFFMAEVLNLIMPKKFLANPMLTEV